MRIALGLAYNGSNYYGWQKQDNDLPTIQNYVEVALSKVANQKIITHCAGRTDAGVHAKGQVIHFDTDSKRDLDAWILGGNSNLPSDISILWSQNKAQDFHARFSAVARWYRYIIYNYNIRSALFPDQITWIYQPLDVSLMHKAAQYLVGEHNFTSFRGSECQAKTPMRHVEKINVIKKNNLIIIDVKANAFLHHMVRNIVGTLLEVGQKKHEPKWLQEVLLAKDRTFAGVTAPPNGLYFMNVYY